MAVFQLYRGVIAFIIFTGLSHPTRCVELLKHKHMARLGAKRCSGLGCKIYNEQFRLRKLLDPTISWSVVDSELWLLYMNNMTSGSTNAINQPIMNDNNLSNVKRLDIE